MPQVIVKNVIMLSFTFSYCNAESRNAECYCAVCSYAECHALLMLPHFDQNLVKFEQILEGFFYFRTNIRQQL
jgi:hypothetical protein